MKKSTIALVGIGVGAGLMYVADPAVGRRRRGRLRDVAAHTSKALKTAAEARTHDVENRLSGLTARSRLLFSAAETPIDDVLIGRVRARLGRLVSHPHAIEVHVSKGVVTLSGGVAAAEASRLLSEVAHIRGVVGVEDRLNRLTVGSGEGGIARHGQWTPPARALMSAAGFLLLALASRSTNAQT